MLLRTLTVELSIEKVLQRVLINVLNLRYTVYMGLPVNVSRPDRFAISYRVYSSHLMSIKSTSRSEGRGEGSLVQTHPLADVSRRAGPGRAGPG